MQRPSCRRLFGRGQVAGQTFRELGIGVSDHFPDRGQPGDVRVVLSRPARGSPLSRAVLARSGRRPCDRIIRAGRAGSKLVDSPADPAELSPVCRTHARMLESPAAARPANAHPAGPASRGAPLDHWGHWGRQAGCARPSRPGRAPGPAQPAARPGGVSCTCNVVREIPNVDNFRPLCTASQARTFSCAQPVDGITPGRRAITASITGISTVPSPCCAQRGRRVCTGYPQGCAQHRWTPTCGRARLSEPSGTTASNGPRGQPREYLPQWGKWRM
jgi:hypothetical protein